MGKLWTVSARLDALCADWLNAEVNILAGLENPRRTRRLARRLQEQFVIDMEGDLNRELRARYPDPKDHP